ncbi:hypothetical protein GE061_007584 [Apolygus lucorum]|uniref:Invertebrate defensins family profile domain-containing protein n=1 Tax=Apolygus lucorum TaxID=248454 RepID=A0A6A4J910_APOLU|nr:hypothetical protein GE061_007584 [Apolygus lucorum]
MKFILILSVVAVCGFVAVSSQEEKYLEVEPGTIDDAVVVSPIPLIRQRRFTCDVGGFACNLHCQWKGYAKGSCRSSICHCNDYSG